MSVQGASTGTATDLEGRYSLAVNAGATLVVALVGFHSQEIPVNKRTRIDIKMKPDLEQLKEVVVIGYGTQEKKDLTGSVGTVDTNGLEGRNISSIEEGLQAQTAGVRVVQGSGQHGGRTLVRVRGQNSILGGGNQLYTVTRVLVQRHK